MSVILVIMYVGNVMMRWRHTDL